MSSRLTVDTTTLKVRDVFCMNTSNGDYIQPASIPVIGDFGKIQWLSSIEFLSSISVPTLSTTILDVLEAVRPGFSTMSTVITSTINITVRSTVTGLGSLPDGNDYISSSKMNKMLDLLSLNYGYISATSLYDSFNNLGDMQQITQRIGPMVKFLSGDGSNLSRGYVSTMNPGNYRIYKSTLGLSGTNVNQTLADGGIYGSATIDITGFNTKIVTASYLRLDVNANIMLSYSGSGPIQTSFSTYLVNASNTSQIIGTPVSLTFSGSNAMIANLNYLLSSNDFVPYPNLVQIRHRLVNGQGSNANLTTQIPQAGGVFATLDNTD
jgi:hypothetical protein